MAKLTETADSYLLAIHPSQKERAKAISGRKWDPNKVCWTYPKTPAIYSAIIAEFGEELQDNNAIPPIPKNVTPSALALHQELNTLQEAVKQLSSVAQSDHHWKSLLRQKEIEAIQIRQELDLAKQKIAQLTAENTRLNSQLVDRSPRDWLIVIKEIAISATAGDPLFRDTISRLNLDNNLPIQLAIEIQNQLQRIMNISGEGLSFADLLTQAKEAEILDKDVINLAHIIRKQRNIMAHETVHPKTIPARVILCLFAAALLWPNLPEP